MQKIVEHYDAVVVGLGGVGAFALRALTKKIGIARRGNETKKQCLKLLGLEQFSPRHQFDTYAKKIDIVTIISFDASNLTTTNSAQL